MIADEGFEAQTDRDRLVIDNLEVWWCLVVGSVGGPSSGISLVSRVVRQTRAWQGSLLRALAG